MQDKSITAAAAVMVSKLKHLIQTGLINNQWECDFIEAIDKAITRGYVITMNQMNKLEELFDTH